MTFFYNITTFTVYGKFIKTFKKKKSSIVFWMTLTVAVGPRLFAQI